MDSLRFDRLARYLAVVSGPAAKGAATPSRRQVLRGAAAGVVSTVALARSPRSAAAELCPERVPRRNYQPTINGCGPSGFGLVIPDTYGDANFTPACNRHDRCYGTCNESRLKCDVLMRKSMKHACREAYGGKTRKELRRCAGRATLYFDAVRNHGQSAFEDAQGEACQCCRAPSTRCGDTCCNTTNCTQCSGGRCRSKCGKNQYCSGGVCKDFDCGPWGCGG